MTAKYIVIEGCDGVGKTTQTQKLVDYLKSQGHKVLHTKEPGTPLSPLTMEMRNLMLNAKYDNEMTQTARELISQAIRSVHIEQVIVPALGQYDYIIQDRGILSGLAYGTACGNSPAFLFDLIDKVTKPLTKEFGLMEQIYDQVIYLTSEDTSGKLAIAKGSKQEFEAGDAMELKGDKFMLSVQNHMNEFSQSFNTVKIDVDKKSIEDVFDCIMSTLHLNKEYLL